MAGKAMDIGHVGRRVAANVGFVRRRQKLPLTDLSQRMGVFGRPIPANGLARIEAGERRVDVEDLVALASCLDTTVVELLQWTAEERTQPAGIAYGYVTMNAAEYDQLIGIQAPRGTPEIAQPATASAAASLASTDQRILDLEIQMEMIRAAMQDTDMARDALVDRSSRLRRFQDAEREATFLAAKREAAKRAEEDEKP